MSSLLLLKSMLFANTLQKKPKIMGKKPRIQKILDKKSGKNNSKMCRICDKERGDIPIFNNFVQPNIPEDILHFTGVTLNKSDNLSQHMCQSCLDLLNGCIMFKEICQKTNRKLIESTIKKESNLETSIKCRIQYDDEDCSDAERNGDIDADADDFFEDFSEVSCTDCGQNHFDVATLNSHIKKCKRKKTQEEPAKSSEETSKKRFLCDVCGKTAQSNANLLSHKTIHEAVFPFKCDECPYMGRTIDLLKVHKRTHMPDKPFKCPHCSKATTTASNLAKHVRHVHSSTKPYKCSYCEKAFTFQHDMKRHIKDIHLRQGTVECEHCFKKFNTRKILRGHQWKVHKIKAERQGRMPAYLQWQIEEQNENRNNIIGGVENVEIERTNVLDVPF